MYTLTHEGDTIGTTNLERGDPPALEASGVFENIGGAKALAAWIKSVGGEEDDGVVYIALNDDFILSDADNEVVNFSQSHLMAVPAQDEVYLEVTLSTKEAYESYFGDHMRAMTGET